MRTPGYIAELCLDYTDVDGLGSASDRQRRFLATIITGALQELFAKRPESFKQRIGATIQAPKSESVLLTAGSTTADFSAFGRDIRGASVKISGAFNQVRPAVASPGSELLMPWTGATGTHTVTVYGDSILVDNPVLGDVQLEGYGPLKPVPDRATLTAARDEYRISDYGMRPPTIARRRFSGMPEVWWAETASIAGSTPQIYLHFAPLPEREYRVTFDLLVNPVNMEAADLDDTDLALPVPDDFVDSIVIPYVLQRWTGSPWFRNNDAKPEIGRQYKTAAGLLADWSPQIQQGAQIIVAGF